MKIQGGTLIFESTGRKHLLMPSSHGMSLQSLFRIPDSDNVMFANAHLVSSIEKKELAHTMIGEWSEYGKCDPDEVSVLLKFKGVRFSNITLVECSDILESLYNKPYVFTDEIPEVLQEDFRKFIVGHTMSKVDGRQVTYDFRMYYDHVCEKGFSYSIKWAE